MAITKKEDDKACTMEEINTAVAAMEANCLPEGVVSVPMAILLQTLALVEAKNRESFNE